MRSPVRPAMGELGPITGAHCTLCSLCYTKPQLSMDYKYTSAAEMSLYLCKFVPSFQTHEWNINCIPFLIELNAEHAIIIIPQPPCHQFGAAVPHCCCFKHNRKLKTATSQKQEDLSSRPDAQDSSQNSFGAPAVFEK